MNDELIKRIYGLILVNNISIDDNFYEKFSYLKELSLLQRKRGLETPILNPNNNFSFQKEINLGMPNVDNFQNNNDIRINGHFPIEQNTLQMNPIINLSEFQGNNNNNLDEALLNKDINNNQNYIFGNSLNFNNINNNINNIIIGDEKENNFINSTNSVSTPSNTYPEENGNKIKVFKNNKTVYMNSYWVYNPTKKPKSSKNSLMINGRSSKYRGVSRNGNNWQVFLMINRNKTYVGTYPSEEIAARVYDIMSIKYRGIKARTNFIYNNDQIKMIKEIEVDLKSKNIYDIISKLIV